MNQAIRNSWVAAVAMFALIFGALSYVQVVGADELKANAWNKRAILQNYCNDRGAIIVGGKPIAESVAGSESCKFQRTYTQPELYAGITGYFSRNFGATGPGKRPQPATGRQLGPAVPGPGGPAVPRQPAQGRFG